MRELTVSRSARPPIRFGLGWSGTRPDQYRVVLPFRRSWAAIAVAGAFLIAMSVPLVSVGSGLRVPGTDLFSVVFELFSLFWLLGWSVGVAIVAVVFLALAWGREVLVAAPGSLSLRLDLFGLGFGARYDANRIRNLRTADPRERDGTAWRGAHLAFDYGGRTVAFGSQIDQSKANDILFLVQHALAIPSSEARAAVPPVADLQPTDEAPGSIVPQDADPVLDDPEAPGFGSTSTVTLILANLVPLIGVVLFAWDLGVIMLLYWAESAIIGFFNLLKMIMIGRWAALVAGPFFFGHYGGFMVGHLLFVYAFFVQGLDGDGQMPVSTVLGDFAVLWPALLASVVSHAVSFRINFVGRREYVGRTLSHQMREPYTRVVVMHVTIIFGGFLAMFLGTPVPALVLLVALKTAADVRAHIREHTRRELSRSRWRAQPSYGSASATSEPGKSV